MSGFAFAPIFGDGMVLQRDKELTIWGTSDCRETVHICLGGIEADSAVVDGVWKCVIPPQKAARDLTVFAKQGDRTISIRDVMIGDVWLAGGQSNMEFFLRYENHWAEARALPKNPLIRMYTCSRMAYAGQAPFQEGSGYWFQEGDSAWETFASAAYWFARELQPELDVPIGIVSCNWGGTSASAWVPAESLKKKPLDVYLEDYDKAVAEKDPEEIYNASMRFWALQADPDHKREWAGVMYGIDRQAQLERVKRTAGGVGIPMGPYNKNRPGCLYREMVLPIRDFAIKGVLWYQGENDVHHAPLYSTLFSVLMEQWRKIWGEDLPFLFAQLAPFDCWLALDGEPFPEIRRQQEAVSKSVENCWMISTADAGMRYDIHPKEKKLLGHRFFLQAMDKVYGIPCLADAPEILSAEREESGICLRFRNVGGGLRAEGDLLSLFQISQNDTRVELEKAVVRGDTLWLNARLNADLPVRVGFAQEPYYEVSLYNSAMIPAKPFEITA